MRKRLAVLFVSLNLAVVAVLGGLLYQKHLELERHQEMREEAYQQAFLELAYHVAEIDKALQKCRYATSDELITALCTEIYGRATVARLTLERLPIPADSLEDLSVFVAQVGNYARALARGAYEGEEHSEQVFSNLSALSEMASFFAGNLNRLSEKLLTGEIQMGALSEGMEGAVEVFSELGGGWQSFRDGRFVGSDHLLEVRPRLLEGLEEVRVDEAKRNVSVFFDLKKELFSYIGSREGDIPVFRFLARVDGGDFLVEVSKTGGQVLWASAERRVRSSPLTKDEGKEVARAFIARNGYENMELRHWWVEDNRVTVKFLHVLDEVVHYPDWMLLSVALDNGRILAFDGMGYVMNHGEREIEAPVVSMDEAAAAIPEQLTVLRHELALIVIGGRREILCHAFLCRDEKGQMYMIYVSAETGRQKDIRILLEDDMRSVTV